MAGTTTTPAAGGTPRAGTPAPTATTPTYGVTGSSTPVTNRALSLMNLRSVKN